LYFHWIEWPVFNVADCCLVAGAGLLLLQAFWAPAGQRPTADERAAEGDAGPGAEYRVLSARRKPTRCKRVGFVHFTRLISSL